MQKYVLIGVCCVVFLAAGMWMLSRRTTTPDASLKIPLSPQKLRKRVVPENKVIDYGVIRGAEDDEISQLMRERKAAYGVEKSIDMIVKSDETIKVGEKTVSMQKILDQVKLKQGGILETDLASGSPREETTEYGIPVVQPTDNIWDIHFRLLKDYYDHKGIQVSPMADEPDLRGRSSGIGKILKFSEHMVHIYGVKSGRLETGLDQIYPLSKIVVYNMSFIFALLDRINYEDVARIEFDGETLWLPAEM